MFDVFAVRRPSPGLVASIDADRFAQDADAGADAAGAADGSQPSGEDAHLDHGDGSDDGADPGDGRAAADDADDEDFEDATDDGPDTPAEERIKKLASALKKAKRKLGTTRAERQRMKELKDRGVHLDDLYADSREYRRLLASAERNPRLRALLSGSDSDPEPRGRSTDRRTGPDPKDDGFTFDDSPEALGFDPKESKANQRIADGLRRVAQLEHTLKTTLERLDPDRLVERVNLLDQRFEHQAVATIRTEWTTAMTAASKQITNEGQRDAFMDLMRFAMEKEGGRRPAKFFVDHYLKKLGVNPVQADRARQAAADGQRNRVAQHVKQLPRQQPGAAAGAPARKTRESVADVHRRLRALG